MSIRTTMALATAVLLAGCEGGVVGGAGHSFGSTELDPDLDAWEAIPRGVLANPLWGGTMAASSTHLVVADTESSVVWVGPTSWRAQEAVAVGTQSAPFRVVLSDDTAFVTLRESGQLAAISLDPPHRASVVSACPEPRGVALNDPFVLVACASGELVTLDHDLEVIDTWLVDADLRDVVVEAGRVWLSRFRSAEVIRVDPDARTVLARRSPRMDQKDRAATPNVAWRMRAHPDGGVLMLHQSARNDTILRSTNRYYGATPADALVAGHVTHVTPQHDVITTMAFPYGYGAYDLVVDQDVVRVVGASNTPEGSTFYEGLLRDLASPVPFGEWWELDQSQGLITSIAVVDGETVVFGQGPSTLTDWWDLDVVPLGSGPPSSALEPARLFHDMTRAGLACVSCHPEGQDDGHVWLFDDTGPRRTQNLAGGVSQRAPFHWNGELETFQSLMGDVFTTGMGGAGLHPDQAGRLAEWLDDVDPIRTTGSPEQIPAGRALFERADVGCEGCHAGPQLSDHQLHQVRPWSEATKTPSLLGVGSRAPYMSDGCAPTLEARFTDHDCGGGDLHGGTSHLGGPEIAALIAYLQSL